MGSLVTVRAEIPRFSDVPALDPNRAESIIGRWAVDVLDAYAKQGLSEVQMLMDMAFRFPTPYYETQVTWDRAAGGRVIHDRGVIYGAWLEGVGSRNFPVTRFKGYRHWRHTAQWLRETEGPKINDRYLPALITALGG